MGYPQGYWLRTEVEQVSMPTAIEHGSAGPEASGNVVVHKPRSKFLAVILMALSVGIAERVTRQPSGAKTGSGQ
jgi:hypothetical protein